MKQVISLLVGIGLLVAPVAWAQERPTTIRWYGHSFFLVTTSDGVRVAVDPFSDIGHTMPTVEADVVTVSHEHGDHNNVRLVGGSPRVLRGLAAGAADWNRIYERFGSTLIYAVPAFHDDIQGTSPRGLDALFVIELGGIRIAHLGDLGQSSLTDGQLRALGPIDVLMIPVGNGPFTMSPPQATAIVSQIRPKIIIPMHYKTPARPAAWAGIDERAFIEGKQNVRRLGSHTLTISRGDLPSTPQIVVMDYQ